MFAKMESTGQGLILTGFSRARVNSNLTFKLGENLPVYLTIV